KRRIYDAGGEQALKEGGGGGGGFSSPMDLFDMFFGGGSRRSNGNRERKGRNTVHQLGVTLEELYNGSVRKLAMEKPVVCEACNGRGSRKSNVDKCGSCRGTGMTVRIQQLAPGIVQQVQTACRVCHGEGEVIPEADKCKTCEGRKTIH